MTGKILQQVYDAETSADETEKAAKEKGTFIIHDAEKKADELIKSALKKANAAAAAKLAEIEGQAERAKEQSRLKTANDLDALEKAASGRQSGAADKIIAALLGTAE